MWLLALFIVVPIVEITIFIQVGGWIGLWPTIGLVILTALAGSALVRAQGLGTLRRLQASLAEGRDPMGPIAHGALILVAGVLLLTPGFFTDAVGIALLLPPVRSAMIRWGAARATVIAAGRVRTAQSHRPPPGDVVEADYIVISEERPAEGDESPRRRADGRASNWTRPPR
jgi:UPF0716 protein FxsA